MGQQVIVTNPTKGNIDVGGTTLTPGSSGTFDIGQVPDKYRKYAVIDMNAPRDQSPIIRSLRYSQIPATQNSDQDIIYRIIDRKGQPLCRVIDGKARWLIEGEMDDLTGVVRNTAGGVDVDALMGRGPVQRPDSAFASVMATLKEGIYSPSINIIGDSTGWPDYQWARKLADRFASAFPSLRVQYERFNNTTQDFSPVVVVQEGSQGERSIRFTGVKGRFQPAADVGDWTTDLDVSLKVSLDNWAPSSQQALVSRMNNTNGQKAFNFYAFFGTLRADLSVDGTNVVSVTSSAGHGLANGAIKWVRMTYTASDGTVRFYTSDDGVSWTQLGSTLTSGVAGALYKPSVKDYEIGSFNGNANAGAGASQKLTGNIYDVRIRNGINGPIMNTTPIDSWIFADGDGTSVVGSQTLYINNGSIPGATLSYLSDSTRLKMLTRSINHGVMLMSCSHNDMTNLSKTQLLDPWSSFLTSLKSRCPNAGFALLTQNPRISPAVLIEAHAQRLKKLMVWASNNNVEVIDTYSAFLKDGRPLTSLIDTDGIHPVPVGGDLWADTVFSRFRGAII